MENEWAQNKYKQPWQKKIINSDKKSACYLWVQVHLYQPSDINTTWIFYFMFRWEFIFTFLCISHFDPFSELQKWIRYWKKKLYKLSEKADKTQLRARNVKFGNLKFKMAKIYAFWLKYIFDIKRVARNYSKGNFRLIKMQNWRIRIEIVIHKIKSHFYFKEMALKHVHDEIAFHFKWNIRQNSRHSFVKQSAKIVFRLS